MNPRFKILIAGLTLFLQGCDDRPTIVGSLPVHPVSGTVRVKGKPAADALVTFYPAAEVSGQPAGAAPRPSGKTDAEGRYQLHSYLGADGAAVGDYTVSITFAGSAENRNFMSKVQGPIANLKIPPKFADHVKSGLTASVKEGTNEVPPFDLK